jgi:VWFA-related protein
MTLHGFERDAPLIGRVRSPVFVACLALGGAMSAEQQPPPQPPQTPPTFRGAVELTRIDVSVLDANRRPVRGLTLEDFELFEDGVPQVIQAVTEINIPDAEEGAAWLRDVAPDVRSNSAEDGRVVLFLLDEAVARVGPNSPIMIATIKRIAGEVIDGMGPSDVAAVLFTWDNKRQAQEFTTDRARLRAAVDRFQPRSFSFGSPGSPPGFGQVGGSEPYSWQQISTGVARSVMKNLIDLPGRRKAFIYVTSASLVRPSWPLESGAPMRQSVQDLYKVGVFEEAMKSGVTVYTINPNGLTVLGGGVEPRARTAAGATGGDGATPPPSSARLFASVPGTLVGETGGFAITNPSHFKEAVAQILRETGSYYILGYVSPKVRAVEDFNPVRGYRKIDVRVKREGLMVRGRTGFVPTQPPKPARTPPSKLSQALSGVLPKDDLALRVTAAPFAVPGRSDAVVLMVLAVEEPAPVERTSDRVDMQARAFTHHGDPRGTMTQSLDVNLPPGRQGDVQFELLSKLPVKPGRMELRLSARSTRLNVEGSVYASLDVPDFAKAPLSMSGLVLSAARGMPAAPDGAFSSILPVVPTSQRAFDAGDRVTGFVRVYQGGKKPIAPVTLTVRVVDRADVAVLERIEPLGAARFGGVRAADYRVELLPAVFAPGPHLLRIHATAGPEVATCELRFVVKTP